MTPSPTAASPIAPVVASPSPSTLRSPAASAVSALLTGNGIEASRELVEFGVGFREASAALRKSLEEPSDDSGEVTSGDLSGCVGPRLRALAYSNGALEVLFRSDSGEPVMIGWRLFGQGPKVPRVRALLGGSATFEFAVGTTVQDLCDGAGTAFEAVPPSEPCGPRFVLRDESSGFGGRLSGTSGSNTVTYVEAGEICGE